MKWLTLILLLFSLAFLFFTAPGGAETPDNDLLEKPVLGYRETKGYQPGHTDTSEYMIGEVGVSVIFVESNGSHDTETEQWNAEEIRNARDNISDSMEWWVDRAEENNVTLNFTLDFMTVETGYEPINRKGITSGTGEGMWLWVDEIIQSVGYSDTNYKGVYDYLNDFKDSIGADWAFAVFVADSSNDSDGKFTDDSFAYAFHGGPFFVMTYDNSNMGIENMDVVSAHETGHIFYAYDEYSGQDSPDVRSGYLNIPNENHEDGGSSDVDCIMRSTVSSYEQGAVCEYTRETIGWRDLDRDSIQDILDTFPWNSLTEPKTQYKCQFPVFNGTSFVNTYPNSNPDGNGNNVTINTIVNVEYKLDDRSWKNAVPVDGLFDSGEEDYRIMLNISLVNGNHTLYIRAWNSAGNFNETQHKFLLNVSFPPEVVVLEPTQGKLGGEIAVNWTAYDPDGNVTGIMLQYLRDGEQHNITGWIENQPPFYWDTNEVDDGSCTIRVIAVDNSSTINYNISEEFTIDNPRNPELFFLPLNGLVSRDMEIFWNASDQDGDNLTFYLDIISQENGASISVFENMSQNKTIETGITHRYSVDTLNLSDTVERIPDGLYRLNLTAVDDSTENLMTAIDSEVFEIDNNDPPSSFFNISLQETFEDQEVIMIPDVNDPEGDILTLYWEFGDGSEPVSGNGNVTHSYTMNGTYVINLSAADQEFNSTFRRTINITNAPPVADAGENITVTEDETFILSGENSTDTESDLPFLEFFWVVDGKDYYGKYISVSLESGNYTVNLTVRDDNRENSLTSVNINVTNFPPIAEAGENQTANRNELIYFDGSGTADSLSDQPDLNYTWDFGDNTTSYRKKPSHSFAAPGTYLVNLTVRDKDGAADTDSLYVTINQVDVAASIDNEEGSWRIGKEITFSAYSTTFPDNMTLSYLWDFGDGAVGYGVEVVHSYEQGGEFEVTLNVQDPDENIEDTPDYSDTVTIRVNRLPKAVIRSKDTILEGESISFSAGKSTDPDGEIIMYLWDFGDGSIEIYLDDPDNQNFSNRTGTLEEGRTVSHGFDVKGTYNITLYVFDDGGDASSTGKNIEVKSEKVDLYYILNSIREDPSLNNEYSVYAYLLLLFVGLTVKGKLSGRKRKKASKKLSRMRKKR